MSHDHNVISLASRRRASPSGLAPAPSDVPARRPDKRAWLAVAVLVGLLAIPLAMMVVEAGVPRSLTSLAASDRAPIFRSAFKELSETCGLPTAAEGVLRDRCRATASFVVLFPECDETCVRMARALLPQARR